MTFVENIPSLRHADRLAIGSRPYSLVGVLGQPDARKRYLHLAAHGSITGGALLQAVHQASGAPPPDAAVLELCGALDRQGGPGFATGALQLRDAGEGRIEAKAYLKPLRVEGAGLRPAAMVLGKVVDRIEPGSGEKVRQELIRRDAIDEVFYVAVSMRPRLEIETYHDVEFRRGDYHASDAWEISSGLAQHSRIAERARACVRLAQGSPLSCNHISCDLLPFAEGGVTVVLSPRDERGARRADHLPLIRALSKMEGCLTKVPETVEDITLDEGLHPSVVAIKIAPHNGRICHAIVLEEVDPEFAELL